MGLNKLENFIKNIEGRILYVNPNDLDATDSIENQGNSLAKPFKTVQRALLEAARFSYIRGTDNDIIEKTSILLFPGEHIVDNRPGFAIKKDASNPLQAKAVAPGGAPETIAQDTLTLNLDSNFDLTQSDNILYKFNSIHGGVVVPRGTSLVGLDLRKTKIRPKYVPNPTDANVKKSSIFKVTGSCYFWQFSIFDGNENGLVYTDDSDFSSNNQSKPSFSHHKLTCFEYADGVNAAAGYDLTDLDMYYSKLSNAYNSSAGKDRGINEKYPADALGFSKQRPEWEIVGAFAADPVNISDIKSGDGSSPTTVVTVTTATAHGLNAGTPIKIKGVDTLDYNISTVVQNVSGEKEFTYLLPFVRTNLPANPSSSNATVTIETDTVAGASPYIFNCSMRSVWGMNGMLADGSKASGFKSMVVAQFTGVSLQKDDRAFVKYNPDSRLYNSITVNLAKGSALNRDASSTDPKKVYHLDSKAIYRSGWETSHIKIQNDAVLQIVSVFAIGFNKHFDIQSGADASITNSNSNFGQISLSAEGFKKDAFDKDNHCFITNIITPKAITETAQQIEWLPLDVTKTKQTGISSHLYIADYTDKDDAPPTLIQGYRLGANLEDKLYASVGAGAPTVNNASIVMVSNTTGAGTTVSNGSLVGEKRYRVTVGPTGTTNRLTIGNNELLTGEKIRVFSDDGDLPENIDDNVVYYVIDNGDNNTISLASTKTNAENGTAISINDGTSLYVVSRVSDKGSGDIGHPIQYDSVQNQWYLHSTVGNAIYNAIVGFTGPETSTNTGYVNRVNDPRSLDDKLYKLRVVIPKEAINAKDPTEGFVIQESGTTGFRKNADASATTISTSDYDFNKNLRFIRTTSESGNVVTVVTEQPHNLNVEDIVNIKKVKSTNNTTAAENKGYNGTFIVTEVNSDKQFRYSTTDVDGVLHANPGTFTNDVSVRDTELPKFERNNCRSNFYIYRNEIISEYIEGIQDGIYHLFALKADRAVPTEFTGLKYSQSVEDLYPQLDKDNYDDNPQSAKSFALRSPVGDVVTDDLKKSITRENTDTFITDFGIGHKISGVSTTTSVATITFERAHKFAQIVAGTVTAGASYTNGTYQNVPLLSGSQTGTWAGATARVVVAGGSVTSAEIVCAGSGYSTGALFFDQTVIGAGNGNARFTVTEVTNNIGDCVQVTGIGTVTDGIATITAISGNNAIQIPRSGTDLAIAGQYVINNGPSAGLASTSYVTSTKVTTFNCTSPHGLVSGNKFRVINVSNSNLGDFIVKERVGVNTFTAITNGTVASPSRIIKHSLAATNAISDNDNESLGARGISFYDNTNLTLGAAVIKAANATSLQIVGINTLAKAPIGSYLQIDNEVMRVSSSSLSGTGNNKLTVIRGVLGTPKEDHEIDSIVKRVNPIATELRRPSIIRASGHTFEYLGFGPGNYSTGLPQVQNRTLTDREDFLAQSQERSCGQVVYTGMNSDGDFFIGNKRVSSSTGKERTFDAPIPTVTGQDPSRLSVVFDEVTIKDRLTVEGGKSKRILSQFDGPVTINNELKVEQKCTVNGALRAYNLDITSDEQSTNENNGALVILGGVGIKKNLNVGGDFSCASFGADGLVVSGIATFQSDVNVDGPLHVKDTTQSNGVDEGALMVDGGVGINKQLYVGAGATVQGKLDVDSDLNVDGAAQIDGNTDIDGTLTVDGLTTINNGVTINAASKNFTIQNGAGTPVTKFDVDTDNGNVISKGTYTSTGDMLPETDEGASLGSASKRWNYLYATNITGTLTGGATKVKTTATNSGTHYLTFVDAATSTDKEDLRVHANFYVSPNTTASSANMYVRGDITAFAGAASDDRLKTNKVILDGALDKVLSLSGFTYNWNGLAVDLGFVAEEKQVGVSAQQVQSVLPEAVKSQTLDDEEILVVKYEKIVPLLIEAIKELSAKVDNLEQKISDK